MDVTMLLFVRCLREMWFWNFIVSLTWLLLIMIMMMNSYMQSNDVIDDEMHVWKKR